MVWRLCARASPLVDVQLHAQRKSFSFGSSRHRAPNMGKPTLATMSSTSYLVSVSHLGHGSSYGPCGNADSDLGGPGWRLSMSISNKLLGDPNAGGPRPHFEWRAISESSLPPSQPFGTKKNFSIYWVPVSCPVFSQILQYNLQNNPEEVNILTPIF